MRHHHHLLGAFGAMLFVGIAWGANMPVTKVMLRHFDLVPMVALRTGMAALSLALLLALLEGRRSLRIDVGLPRFLMLGLLAAGFFAMYAVGIYFSNPISAAAVQAAGPLVAAITVRLVTGQPFDPGFRTALGLTILGGLILVAGGLTDTARITLGGGEIIVLLSNVLWTIYSLKAQAWFDRASQLHRTYVGTFSSCLWLSTSALILVALGLSRQPFAVSGLDVWAPFIAVAVLANGLGNYFWNIGASRLGVAVASLWVNLMPFFAVMWAMLYGFMPNVYQIVGGLVAVCGVVYMQWRKLQAAAKP